MATFLSELYQIDTLEDGKWVTVADNFKSYIEALRVACFSNDVPNTWVIVDSNTGEIVRESKDMSKVTKEN